VDNDDLLAYLKGGELLVVVNVNPVDWREATISIPPDFLPRTDVSGYEVEDLLDGARYRWSGDRSYVQLDPIERPAHIFRVVR
jgi:starch synthase (maltosyl-transferring)